MKNSTVLRLRSIAAGVVCAVTTAAPAAGQAHAYCFEGSLYTCVNVQLHAQSTSTGTRVTVFLGNLEGAPPAGVTAMTPWARVVGVELIGKPGAFTGGTVDSVDPFWASYSATSSQTVIGNPGHSWVVYNIADSTAGYEGFALTTFPDSGGTDIIGCSLPPAEAPPYFQTCNRSGISNVGFTFSTNGHWQATDPAIVLSVSDEFGDEQTCLIPGTTYDDPTAYHCVTPSAPPLPLAATILIQPSTISLSTTPTVSVILLSEKGLDASAINPANVLLHVGASPGADATPAMRGTSVVTAVRDYNGDGLPDRMITFTMSALKAAGLTTNTAILSLYPSTGSPWAWVATPPATPNIVP